MLSRAIIRGVSMWAITDNMVWAVKYVLNNSECDTNWNEYDGEVGWEDMKENGLDQLLQFNCGTESNIVSGINSVLIRLLQAFITGWCSKASSLTDHKPFTIGGWEGNGHPMTHYLFIASLTIWWINTIRHSQYVFTAMDQHNVMWEMMDDVLMCPNKSTFQKAVRPKLHLLVTISATCSQVSVLGLYLCAVFRYSAPLWPPIA